jgi:PDZ domain-containing protein
MTRRDTTLVIALGLLVAMIVAANYIKVPYVILQPGPVTDTLGTVKTGTGPGAGTSPVISISGTKTQTSSGHLYLTTVQSLPCGVRPTLWDAVQGWFDSHDAVEPYEVECPPNENPSDVRAQEAHQMTESQTHAVVAAFTELGYRSTGNRVVINSVSSAVPAGRLLRRGDVIEAVAGKPMRTTDQVAAAVLATTAPGPIKVVVLRNNQRLSLRVPTVKGDDGKTRIGINLRIAPTFNNVVATIGIDPKVIGGPSAGTALALGIIDKLTPGGLTGGRTIAGTGTVSPTGQVGEIGGIQQKIAAAAAAHATVFFAPAGECSDAKSAAPSSMTVVSVKTLHDAVLALQAIKSGSTDFPHC